MPHTKLLVLTTLAVLALSAPATAVAAGGEWLVNETPLASGATLALLPTALILAAGKLVIPGLGSIECIGEQLEVEEGKIIGPDGILAKKLGFNKCRVAESEVCSLENEKIQSVPLHGLALLDGPSSSNAYISILPETKTVFATIKFSGASCVLAGTQPITGGISFLVHEASKELLSHLVLAFSLPKALKIGSVEVELKGLDFDIALLQHEKWSFR